MAGLSLPTSDPVTVTTILSIALYLGLLSLSGYLIGEGSEILGRKMGASVGGGLVFGFIATVPEYVFAMTAVYLRSGEIALGSALGGNIILFTLGVSALLFCSFKSTSYKPDRLWVSAKSDILVLASSTLILLAGSLFGFYPLIVGILFLGLYLYYVYYTISHRNFSLETRPRELGLPRRSSAAGVTLMVVGMLVLAVVVKPLVYSIKSVSYQFGAPPLLIATLVIPLVDELPEILGLLILSSHGADSTKVAEAAIVGSKLQSNTLLLGSMITLSYIVGNPLSTYSGAILPLVVAVSVSTTAGVFSLTQPGIRRVTIPTLIALYVLAIAFGGAGVLG